MQLLRAIGLIVLSLLIASLIISIAIMILRRFFIVAQLLIFMLVIFDFGIANLIDYYSIDIGLIVRIISFIIAVTDGYIFIKSGNINWFAEMIQQRKNNDQNL
jgi:hypothetical protein